MEPPGVDQPAEHVRSAWTWSEVLRRLRVARGLSLSSVAERVGCAKGYLSELERGLRPPPGLELLGRLEREVGAAPGWLFWEAASAGWGAESLRPRWVPILNTSQGRAPCLRVARCGAGEGGVDPAAACAGIAVPPAFSRPGAFGLYVRTEASTGCAGGTALAIFAGPAEGSSLRLMRAPESPGQQMVLARRGGGWGAAVVAEPADEANGNILHFFAKIAEFRGGGAEGADANS